MQLDDILEYLWIKSGERFLKRNPMTWAYFAMAMTISIIYGIVESIQITWNHFWTNPTPRK